MWPYLSETHFFSIDCTDFFICSELPRGYQADNLRMSLARIHFFSADDLDMLRPDCAPSPALFMYMRIHVLVPTRLRGYIIIIA